MVAHTSTQGTEAEESSQLSCQSGLQSNTLYEEEKKTLQRTSNEQLHSNSFQLPSKKSKIHFLTSLPEQLICSPYHPLVLEPALQF